MTTRPDPTGADRFFEVLTGWDIEHLFICPGTTEAPLLDASLRQDSVDLVVTTHESIAVAMGDGYSRASSEPSAVYLHTNVGLTNGLGHLYAAQLAASPVVLFTGVKPQAIQGRNAFTHSRYLRDFVRPYCKWDWQTLQVDELAEDVQRAIQVAVSPPSGPTFLALSQDLLGAATRADVTSPHLRPAPRHRPSARETQQAASMLLGAQRPVLLIGGPTVSTRGVTESVKLAELLNSPVMVDPRFQLQATTFPTEHRLYLGLYETSHPAVVNGDVILIAGSGSQLEFEESEPSRVPPGAHCIHLCADAGELGRSHRTDVALLGDVELGLADLHAAVEARQTPSEIDGDQSAEVRPGVPERPELTNAWTGTSNAVRDVVAALAEQLPPNAIVISDAVTAQNDILDLVPRCKAGDFVASASGSLGWGAGAALGVAFAEPEMRAIAFLGDGVFQFGIQALWTANHYSLPVTFVVFNNSMYLAVRYGLLGLSGTAAKLGRFPGVDISGPDIAAIARGFGLPAKQVSSAAEAASALDWANDRDGPALVEVLVAAP